MPPAHSSVRPTPPSPAAAKCGLLAWYRLSLFYDGPPPAAVMRPGERALRQPEASDLWRQIRRLARTQRPCAAGVLPTLARLRQRPDKGEALWLAAQRGICTP